MFPVEDIQNSKMKFTGRSKAIVISNSDPERKGRIRVSSPVLGETTWIPYLQLPFSFDVPEPKDIVFIECDGGFETHPIAWGKLPSPDAETVTLPDTFRRFIPSNRGSYTPGGHLIEYDDGDSITGIGEGIRFTTADESTISINEDVLTNTIVIEKSTGQSIILDGNSDSIEITTFEGHNISMQAGIGIIASNSVGDSLVLSNNAASISNAAGSIVEISSNNNVKVEDVLGNKIETTPFGISVLDNQGNKILTSPDGIDAENSSGGKLQLTATTSALLDSTGAGVKSSFGQVALGNSTVELLDLIDQAFTALSTQTAPGFGSPTSTIADFVQLSAKIKTLKGSL